MVMIGSRDSSLRINPGGFSCRWLGHVGKDQPGPDSDVPRAHAICVVGVSAADPHEFLSRGAVLLSNVPTVCAGAGAGGVARVHRDQRATGAVSPGARGHPGTPPNPRRGRSWSPPAFAAAPF